MGILDTMFGRKPTATVRYPSVREIQAQKLKRIMRAVRARRIEKPPDVFKLRHMTGLCFAGSSIVPAHLPVSLTRGSLRDIDPWWHSDPVRRHYGEEELTEERRVGKTDKYLVRTDTRDIVLLDGRKLKTIRKVYYDKKQRLHSKELFAQDESGKVFAFNQIPRNLMALDGLDLVAIQPNKDIVVVEGSPAAEALRKRGMEAVGIISGTFAIPSERTLAPLLKAKYIVLWPDNDSAGAHLMSQVARTLHRMGARTDQIKLVFWRGGPRKGDAYDFAGNDEELQKLFGEAITWSPELRFATNSILRLSAMRAPLQLRLDYGAQPPTPEVVRERTPSVADSILTALASNLVSAEPEPGEKMSSPESHVTSREKKEG